MTLSKREKAIAGFAYEAGKTGESFIVMKSTLEAAEALELFSEEALAVISEHIAPKDKP